MIKFIPNKIIEKRHFEWCNPKTGRKITWPLNPDQDCPECGNHFETVRMGLYHCAECGEFYMRYEQCVMQDDGEGDYNSWIEPHTPEEPMEYKKNADGEWRRVRFWCDFCGRLRPEEEHYRIEGVSHLSICQFCKTNRNLSNQDLMKMLSRTEKRMVSSFMEEK